ncbi:hypothetical protein BASA81_008595 [Batrachochytrium salamandrivorans]|nr:hypothetical protein BASA81_008595 [Batrachochytrium salamandrivorans]
MMNSEPPDKHRSIKQIAWCATPRHSEPSSALSTRPITVHALQFLKLYLLRDRVKLPVVTEHLVVSIMNVLCGESEHQETRGGKPATLLLKQELLEFHRVPSGAVVEWELSTFSRKALTVSAAEAWGDWSRGSQMKFLEPTKGVGMRKLFSRAGYEVVLVDEFRTSCTCFGCEGGACEKFRSVMNPRSWMREKRPMVLRNGLLRCKTCERLWNRDRNGSLNIMRCAQAARLGGQRPSYMTRNFSEARSAVTTQGAGLPTMAVFI